MTVFLLLPDLYFIYKTVLLQKNSLSTSGYHTNREYIFCWKYFWKYAMEGPTYYSLSFNYIYVRFLCNLSCFWEFIQFVSVQIISFQVHWKDSLFKKFFSFLYCYFGVLSKKWNIFSSDAVFLLTDENWHFICWFCSI